jgi:uncharacterized protein (TIGR00255 family)
MTAYGQSRKLTSSGTLLIELHIVNRKTFDLSSHLPKEYLCCEMEIRKLIQKKIKRGQVTLRLTREMDTKNLKSFLPDPQLLQTLKHSWDEIATNLKLSPNEVNLQFLTEQVSRLSTTDTVLLEKDKEQLLSGLQEALEACEQMKKKEGHHLQEDIESRLDVLSKFSKQLSTLSEKIPEIVREKLHEKIKDLLTEEDEQRFQREVVYYAEKSDITEEITRLNSHINQFQEKLSEKEDSIGRTLDFILQEMHREVNTISSKSTNLELSKIALNMKSEIDKIREQVQNVE